jgi:hypothetical protein
MHLPEVEPLPRPLCHSARSATRTDVLMAHAEEDDANASGI